MLRQPEKGKASKGKGEKKKQVKGTGKKSANNGERRAEVVKKKSKRYGIALFGTGIQLEKPDPDVL
jgi:hypothetical protein